MLRSLEGVVVFLIVTMGLTFGSALLLVQPLEAQVSWSTMLRASVIYVAVVGWQPLIGFAIARRFESERLPFDEGLRRAPLRGSLLSVGFSLFVLAVAVALHTNEPTPDEITTSPIDVARVVLAFAGVVALLWFQAIVEELGWRSYVLPRLMRAFGPWPGLLAHGVLWGLCYAPWFALSGGSIERSIGYAVTCCLLGIVLGWLRLASHSILASAASNATLTICAGLPVILVGGPSQFSAAFEPAGWIPLAMIVAAIALHRPWRRAVEIPWLTAVPRAQRKIGPM